MGHCPSHTCCCIKIIKQRRSYVKQSLYRLHDIGRGAVSVWRTLVLPGECTFKLQITERGSSTTKLCLAVTNPRISVAQPSLKRLRLCSCHETLQSLLKNRKWAGLFYLTLSDMFRVEAPVTRRSPHSAVREDFPHTVPQNTQAFAYGLPGQSHPAWRITLLPN